MRVLPVIAIASLGLAGCAHTGVSLFDGEKHADGTQNPTGALAVLDPETGQDLDVVDQIAASRYVRKGKVRAQNISSEKLTNRYGALLSSLPEQPRQFILYFKAGTTDLVDESTALIPALFAEVKRRPGADVQIVGHSDTTGPEELNDELSAKRADQVKIKLAGLGLDSSIVRTSGRGERELREQTPDETPSELNRRVEIFIK